MAQSSTAQAQHRFGDLHVSLEEIAEYRGIFTLLDSGNTGVITRKELQRFMKSLRLQPTEAELDALFQNASVAIATSPVQWDHEGVDDPTTATGTSSQGTARGVKGPLPASVPGMLHASEANPKQQQQQQFSPLSHERQGITFSDFVHLMAQRAQSDYTPEQLRSAFQLFESAGSADGPLPEGYVSTAVLHHALTTYGSTQLSDVEATELLALVDPNGSGMVDYVRFVAQVTGDDSVLWGRSEQGCGSGGEALRSGNMSFKGSGAPLLERQLNEDDGDRIRTQQHLPRASALGTVESAEASARSVQLPSVSRGG